MKLLPQNKVLGGLGLTIFLIVAVGVVSYVSTLRTVATAEAVTGSYNMVQSLAELSAQVQTHRMCARGYVMTGDEHLFDLYNAAAQQVQRRLMELSAASERDPLARQRYAAIVPLVNKQLGESAELIHVRKNYGALAAAWVARSQYRNDADGALRNLIDPMIQEGTSQLIERRAQARSGRRSLLVMVIIGCFLELAVALAAAGTIRSDIRRRKQTEQELLTQTAQLISAKNAMEKQSQLLQSKSEQLELARQSADAANEAKSAFLANMSHEIRTPMTAILGYADVLLDGGGSGEERDDWLRVIRRNGRHLLELINDILDLSKIEAGKMTVESVACDPSQIAADIVSTMRPRAEERGIELRLEFDGPPGEVRSDPLRLRQVLVNLIGNAIKFTEAGEVAVCVGSAACDGGTQLRIDVCDTGIGMTPAQLAKLFRPFTQADESTTRRFGGTGLGLTISKRLVELLGGELNVRSEEGIGSTFTVLLNAVEGSRADECNLLLSPATPHSLELVALNGRILLADDGEDNQRLIAMLLRSAGGEVVIADNGRAAVDLAVSHHFDVVLMDMQMPGVDGYTAAGVLRKMGITTPIIAVTAHAMSGDRERCLAAGCTDYLTKPIDRNLLLYTVSRHLRKSAAMVA